MNIHPSNILSVLEFKQLQALIKLRTIEKTLTSLDIMIYNIVRGLPINRGFTPILNACKIKNGSDPNYAERIWRHHIKYHAKTQPDTICIRFNNIISREQLKAIAKSFPTVNGWAIYD